ncbi:extracellular calcium-sensing receptor-like isoform X2 [Siniperca chuatsi]|uniref:extracellular calcium-sensing receptor-like isoform X2 n=1 Tax=Siniperca chuatsi TaxID=119488 RepID=UPI001CE03158|nr:extracellular calcium-sensing receptor-like isoform X2 [Siniperca chuatsi]
MTLLRLLLLVLLMGKGDSVCRLQGSARPAELAQDGDLFIGGIFSFRTEQDYVINTFQTIPEVRKCKNFNFREFKFAQAMIFAINEINKNPDMLPNVKLGYKIYDNCGTMDIVRAAVALMSGLKGELIDDNCTKTETVQAILGHSGSRPTIAFAQVVGRFQIPVISHFATCACLSNRKDYPTFFRTIPSDYYQSRALAKLVKHFGWTWIGALAVDNEYGLNGVAAFIQAAQEYGVCIEYSKAFSSSDPPDSLQRTIEIIKHATSKVIIAFMSHREMKLLAKELYKQNITGLQWVGSDAWITDQSLTDSEGHSILMGSLGFTVSRVQIPGLEEHLRQLHPSQFPDSQFVRDFWEYVFDCALNETANTQRKPCNGSESLKNVVSEFTDVAELRFTNNVYKSVYAVGHALDNLIKCEGGKGPFSNGSCADSKHIQPWQVLHFLSTVNFTTEERERVYFDSNGDSPARYELVNLQMTNKGTMEGVTVGIYDASLPESHQFVMNNIPVVWRNCLTEVKQKLRMCPCQSAVRAVSQELIRSSRKESQSAVIIAYPVQQARSVI